MRSIGLSPKYVLVSTCLLLVLACGAVTQIAALPSEVIAFDSAAITPCTSNSFPPATPCTSILTWSHTIGDGSNRILIVGVSFSENYGSTNHATSITYGSSSLALIVAKSVSSGITRAEAWYLMNPPTGTDAITVTFSTIPAYAAVGGSVSYFNVGGLGGSGVAEGSSAAAAVTVSANAGDLVMDVLATAGSFSATPGQTERWNVSPIGSTMVGAGSDEPASSPVTMTWTLFSSSAWALVGVDLQPPATTAALPVGGEVIPIDQLQVLMPWVLFIATLAILSIVTLRGRRTRSN